MVFTLVCAFSLKFGILRWLIGNIANISLLCHSSLKVSSLSWLSLHAFFFFWFSMVRGSGVPLITSSCSASTECTTNKWGKMKEDKNEGSRMGARGRCLMSHRPTKPSSILIAAQSELIISSALHSPNGLFSLRLTTVQNPEALMMLLSSYYYC